jgi:hypothetical protein
VIMSSTTFLSLSPKRTSTLKLFFCMCKYQENIYCNCFGSCNKHSETIRTNFLIKNDYNIWLLV